MSGSTAIQSNFSSHSDNGVGQKSTHSVWIKRADPSGDTRSTIISGNNGSAGYMKVRFADNDRLMAYGTNNSGTNCDVQTKREFRDVFGWLHVVLQIDTSAGTASDRVKWYVNGELQELYGTPTYPSQGERNHLTTADDLEIGRNAQSDNEHFDGYMSHFHCTDGYLTAPSVFGSTDNVTGEWQINASPTVANYGTYGYWIFKDGTNLSGSTIQDQSGQGNNFTLTQGTLTPTQDNPSNVFATCNSLYKDGGSTITYTNGNTTVDVGSGNSWCTSPSTLGMPSGKFYFEAKLTLNSNNEAYIGVANQNNLEIKTNEPNYIGEDADTLGWYSGDGSFYWNASSSSYGSSWTTGDIVGCAIDIDNSKIYFHKNGTWQNSGDPTSGATGTGAKPLYHTAGDIWHFCVSPNQSKLECNFGNGYFGTTAVSSAGTNASGIGIFEYDVPTGYTALSTKGLNE